MMTTNDLIEIFRLYYTQETEKVRKYPNPRIFWPDYSLYKPILRCSMYALSARLILEGVY